MEKQMITLSDLLTKMPPKTFEVALNEITVCALSYANNLKRHWDS